MPVRNPDPIQRLKLAEKYTRERDGSSLPTSYRRTFEFLGFLSHSIQREALEMWDSTGTYVEEHYPEESLTIQKHRLLEIREYGGPLPGTPGEV